MGLISFLAGALGLSPAVVQFLLCFVATIPCSYYHKTIPTTHGRHLFAFVSGAGLSVLAYGMEGNWHFLVAMSFTYLAMVFFRNRCGLITFIVTFTHLIGCHVWFMSGDAWKEGGIDFTGSFMLLTLKLTSCAMNYQDGAAIAEAKKEGAGEGEVVDARRELSVASKARSLEDLPSPLEFAGYCFCNGSIFAGPVFEMKDYLLFSERKGVWAPDVPRVGEDFATFSAVFFSLLSMGMYMYLTPRNPVSRFTAPVYMEWSFYKRIQYINSVAFAARWKYYFVWKIAEISMIASGLGYKGPLAVDPWEGAKNARPLSVEFATSGTDFPKHWNISVGNWLRLYVYERLTPTGKKAGFWELMGTQVISGIWHGIHVGQIVYFVHSAIFIAGSKVIYRWIVALPPHRHLTRLIATSLHGTYAAFCNNYGAVSFLLLDGDHVLTAYWGVYFTGTILPVAVVIFGAIVKPPKKANPYPKKEE